MRPEQVENSKQERRKTLKIINKWCYERTSYLSLQGQDQEAQAVTEEHMEILQNIRPEKILWMAS